MSEAVLSLNAGSSSIKFSVYALRDGGDAHGNDQRSDPGDGGALRLRCRGEVTAIGRGARLTARNAQGHIVLDRALGDATTHALALAAVREWIEGHLSDDVIVAAGHRVVHGGDRYDAPVLVDEEVLRSLEQLAPLAPSHQPLNLAAIETLSRLRPDLPQVACFDTAFHETQPAVARAYALPRGLSAAGVRRYGFHGLSYEYIAEALPRIAGEAADGRVVVAHLGHGAGMCAMLRRRSVATTMGLTVLDGLPMGQRCGVLDPGVVIYLVRERGLTIAEVEDLLYHDSGLLGVSGISDDMRELLASSEPAAAEAVELFCYRIGRELGSLAAALGGLDVLVFTGGIGEHAAPVRARVCRQAAWLGVRIDEDANERGERHISAGPGSPAVFIMPTDEELVIARHTWRVALRDRSSTRRG